MTLRAESVSDREFTRAWRGYARGEVDAFLRDVAAQLRELEEELAGARQAAREAGESERLLQRTLVAAQRTADETVAMAREEAAQVLSQTAADAEEVMEAARRDAASEREAARRLLVAARDAVEQLRRFRDDYHDRVRLVVAEQLAALDRAGELPEVPDDLDGLAAADIAREVRLDDAAAPAGDVTVSALGDGPAVLDDDATSVLHGRRGA